MNLEPVYKYYLSPFFVPGAAKLQAMVTREQPVLMHFPFFVSDKKIDKLVRKLRRRISDDYLVFDAGRISNRPRISFRQIISAAEIEPIKSTILAATAEFKKQATSLANEIISLNNLSDGALYDNAAKIKKMPQDWECFQHGQHLRCSNELTGQVIEIPIWYGDEYGVLDPWFLCEFINTTEGLTMPEAIIDEYEDVNKILKTLKVQGQLKEIVGRVFNVKGLVSPD